jgi:hypothetical protein
MEMRLVQVMILMMRAVRVMMMRAMRVMMMRAVRNMMMRYTCWRGYPAYARSY